MLTRIKIILLLTLMLTSCWFSKTENVKEKQWSIENTDIENIKIYNTGTWSWIDIQDWGFWITLQ